jgi:menaquinone-dependent protoporphyrinogen oxidase
MSKVLVAYATKYGSMMEVAEAVAEELRGIGVDAELLAAHDVDDVTPYSAVVVGGPFYYFRWHGDVRHFLKKHHKALAQMPVAVFGGGPFNNDPKEFADVRAQLDKAVAKFDWLEPKTSLVVGGVHRPERLRFPDNNPGMKNLPPSDVRDFDEIRQWARALPEVLGVVAQPMS